MNRRNILFSAFNMYKGGSLTYFERMSKVLKEQNHILLILSNEMQTKFHFAKVVTIPYPIPFINQIYRLILEQLFIPVVAFFKCVNLIVMMGNFPCIFWFGKQKVLFHNTLYLGSRKTMSPTLLAESLLFQLLSKLKRPEFLVQTYSVAHQLESYFNSKCKVTLVGIPSRENLAISHGLSSKPFSLFYPAGFYPHKNHEFFLALKEYDKLDEIEITLTVDKYELSKACGSFSTSDSFKCVGNVDFSTINSLYKKCDALIFLSATESLGLPLIEACEYGLPIIAPGVEYVESAIHNFYSFDLYNPQSLRFVIDEFLKDKKYGACKVPSSKISFSEKVFYNKVISV